MRRQGWGQFHKNCATVEFSVADGMGRIAMKFASKAGVVWRTRGGVFGGAVSVVSGKLVAGGQDLHTGCTG
jgi:hypothetical protein